MFLPAAQSTVQKRTGYGGRWIMLNIRDKEQKSHIAPG